MNLGLEGQAAVIVGAARGIGLAIASEFAAEGCRVALLDRDPVVTDIAIELARKSKQQAVSVVADASHHADVVRAAESCRTALGRITHLVFAVGVGSGKFGFPFWNLEPSDWARVVEVNLLAAVNVLHAFVPDFLAAKTGSILLISSVAGQIGSQTDPPYSAAKAGVINFMQCAARDFAPHGVRVNALCPGMVRTEINQAVWKAWHDQQPATERLTYEEWAGEKVRKVVPLGRWQSPEDMAAMAVFLASERGANITGQCLNVDGGFVMHW